MPIKPVANSVTDAFYKGALSVLQRNLPICVYTAGSVIHLRNGTICFKSRNTTLWYQLFQLRENHSLKTKIQLLSNFDNYLRNGQSEK